MADFLYKSTGVVIKFLDKILKSNITIEGGKFLKDNKNPVLYVANHFTRAETFIIPYVINQINGKKTRSLADNSVFVGALGSYLRKMGTLSVSDPERDHTIISDLITGRYDWLIYPEGSMIKNKKICKRGNYCMEIKENQLQAIKTGSAVLVMKTALLKKLYRKSRENSDNETLNHIRDKYKFAENETISPLDTLVVPVNITYYPIRTGNNKLHNLFKRFIKKIPARVDEELEIESNLLLFSDINVYFGEPINIPKFIDRGFNVIQKIPYISEIAKRDLVLKFYRYRLTNSYMEQIYDNLCINLDHIFAFIIFNYANNQISINHLKRLIYLLVHELKSDKDKKYRIHNSISNLYKLFDNEDCKEFDSIFNFALSQNIISLDLSNPNIILISQDKIKSKDDDFHKIRLTNTIKVMYYELLQIDGIENLLNKAIRLGNDEAKNEVTKIIFEQNLLEFEDDYNKYFTQGETKPQDIGTPSFYPSAKDNDDVCIIISHGYKSAPEEVRELAKYLNNKDFSVYVARLKGHGTSSSDMKNRVFTDWYESFNQIYSAASNKYKKVIVIGFSTGGLLGLLMAIRKNNSDKIHSIICINAALKLQDIRTRIVPTINLWNEILDKIHSSAAKLEYIEDEPENPHINYSRNYLRSVEELSKLMNLCEDNLSKITIPTLIIQATKDPIVNPKSAKLLFKQLSSQDKELFEIDLAHHVIVRKEGSEDVFAKIFDFIKARI